MIDKWSHISVYCVSNVFLSLWSLEGSENTSQGIRDNFENFEFNLKSARDFGNDLMSKQLLPNLLGHSTGLSIRKLIQTNKKLQLFTRTVKRRTKLYAKLLPYSLYFCFHLFYSILISFVLIRIFFDILIVCPSVMWYSCSIINSFLKLNERRILSQFSLDYFVFLNRNL